jgi:hypothetical protein
MLVSLVLSAALAAAPEPAPPSGTPPQQAVAVIDGEGNLRITIATCNCFGPGVQEMPAEASEKTAGDKASVKVKISSVTLTTVELPAKAVDAYTADGTAIKKEKLSEMLAKERAVLVSLDGKKVDPFLLQLYKEGTIVLVPPANVVNGGGLYPGGFFGPPPVEAVPAVPPPGPIDRPKLPEEKKP